MKRNEEISLSWDSYHVNVSFKGLTNILFDRAESIVKSYAKKLC